MKVLYTAVATASGGREGVVRSSDGVLDLALSMPKELGGQGRHATNPEQLFAAGYAACFENAMLRAARERRLSIEGSTVTASVGIGRAENGRFRLDVALEAALPGLSAEDARAVATAAHEEICPYSDAVRGALDVRLTVTPGG